MPNIVLSEKIFPKRSKESLAVLKDKLRERASGLEVESKILGLTPSGWPHISMFGPDEEVYKQILQHHIGFAFTKRALLESNTITRAYINGICFRQNALELDIGLNPDENIQVECPETAFRSQLLDGRRIPLRKILAQYCLSEGFPLRIRIPKPFVDLRKIQVVLSDSQVQKLTEWQEEPFERLIIQGAYAYEIERAMKTLRITRDLAQISELSLIVSVLTCKLGTKAKGLIPKLGPLLKQANFCVFSKDDQIY